MKKFIYLFTLFALCIGLTIAHAASPTYDDEPPSYIWGSGGLNAQTSGTPNRSGEDRIIEAIENMDGGVGSISIDTSAIESYLHVGDGQTATSTITDLINGIGTDTGNIEAYLKKTDGENTVTVTDLINGIGTDTNDIKNDLKVDNKTVTELVNGIGTDTKNIESYLKVLDSDNNAWTVADLLYTISQPQEFRTARLSITANTATEIPYIENDGSVHVTRIFVELRAIDPDAEFYIGFNSLVTDSNGRPVKGRILLSLPVGQDLYVYHTNASAIAVQQTEGWR